VPWAKPFAAGVVGLILATTSTVAWLIKRHRPASVSWDQPDLSVLAPDRLRADQPVRPFPSQRVKPIDSQPARPGLLTHSTRVRGKLSVRTSPHYDPPKHATMGDEAKWPVIAMSDLWSENTIEMVETVCLVSCVGLKRATPAPAKELYQSDWFTKARVYAERVGSRWYILSAKHGLVHPDDVIAPYEQTLNAMGVSERRTWAHLIQSQMDRQMPDAMRIEVLAGKRYREFLMDYLNRRAGTVDVPMAGLRIGEQLRWLGSHVGHGPQS
jgi:hypothetical protein